MATSSTRAYFRLLKRASGPEIVDFVGLNGHLLPQNPLDQAGGFTPHLFQWFCGRNWPFRPPKSTLSGPETVLSNLKQARMLEVATASLICQVCREMKTSNEIFGAGDTARSGIAELDSRDQVCRPQ